MPSPCGYYEYVCIFLQVQVAAAHHCVTRMPENDYTILRQLEYAARVSRARYTRGNTSDRCFTLSVPFCCETLCWQVTSQLLPLGPSS